MQHATTTAHQHMLVYDDNLHWSRRSDLNM